MGKGVGLAVMGSATGTAGLGLELGVAVLLKVGLKRGVSLGLDVWLLVAEGVAVSEGEGE
jgi:hypothetical protein